jgi:hypothetical protein
MRDQAIFHLLQAKRVLAGRVDHDITAADRVSITTAYQHVTAGLRALEHDSDQYKHREGGTW